MAEFDRRQGWGTWECRSCAHWLNWKCGIDVATARQKVRVAHCLRQLPAITAAFAAGRLSYSKVWALTRVATPDNEGDLLELALTGTASHLERIVRAYRGALRDDEVDTANHLHDRRNAQWHHDDDGSFVLSARLTPEQGALVRQALEAATESVDNGSAEPLSTGRESRGQRQADALVAMAQSFLATGGHAGRSGDHHLVALHVDAEVLAGDAEGRCELEDGPALAAETARRLGCDAAVVAVVEDGRGTPLDVGRKTRSIPPCHPPGAAGSRRRVPLPRMHQPPLRRRPPHPPLGRRRRDQPGQPGAVVPEASPGRPRGWLHRRSHRRPARARALPPS